MHFWIDKRSQCGYTGRHRVPTSLSSGRPRSRSAGRKGMPAPVHRFTAVATVECPPRRPHRPNNYSRAQSVPVHASRRAPEEPMYVEVPVEPQPTIASLAAARSVTPDTLLRTAALGLHNSQLMAPHLKYGMLVSFVIAAVFVVGAKYYVDRQMGRDAVTNGEVVIGLLMVIVGSFAGVGCAMTVCKSRATPPLVPDRVSSTAQRHHMIRLPTFHLQEGSAEEVSLQVQARVTASPAAPPAQPSESPEAPPPYHIAVLLPRDGCSSPPPPAYSALS